MKAFPGSRPRLLVLGLGNDIMTDDAVGLRLAGTLRERFARRPDLAVEQTSEMGLSLLDLIAGYETVVLVDAVQTRKQPPAYLYDFDAADLGSLPAISPHFLGVGEILALGRKLELPMPARVRIFAVEVEDPFTVGTGLSPALESALPGLAERLGAEIEAMAG